MVIYNKKVMVTKMSFCNLIKRETSEYTKYFDEITLTESNKKLVSGEFIKAEGQNVEVRVRICLGDLTSGSRGAHPARAPPPNGRGPMIFLCPKR